MTLTIPILPETEKRLRELAAQAGQTVEVFIGELVERGTHSHNGRDTPSGTKTFDQIFGPLRKEVDESGVSDEELDNLLAQAREQVWEERKANQDKNS